MDVSENTLQLSNGQMHYIQFGNGKKTFVIIAGMSMTGISGMGQVVADMYRAFTDEYTVYLFERLSCLPDGYTIRNMADDVAAAMNLLCISDADIMGASQGGMIALYLAIDHPELVHSMVLASSCCRQNNVGKLTFKLWSELADRRDGRAIYRDFFSRVYTVSPADLLKKLKIQLQTSSAAASESWREPAVPLTAAPSLTVYAVLFSSSVRKMITYSVKALPKSWLKNSDASFIYIRTMLTLSMMKRRTINCVCSNSFGMLNSKNSLRKLICVKK